MVSIAELQYTEFVNDGGLVVLEWHTDKSLHHARVLVKDTLGDPCAYSLLVFVNWELTATQPDINVA